SAAEAILFSLLDAGLKARTPRATATSRQPPAAQSFRVRSRIRMAWMIQAENVRKTYHIGKVDVPALRGVFLEVEKGEFVSIVGPSGSGKSTKFNLLPTLTAQGNIDIARDIAGKSNGSGNHEYINRITRLLGIDQRLEHRPSELSGGEQQRVALARALVNQPAIVLADEPTGNLDSQNSEIVLKMLRQSNQELGQTVLMITHNPEAATYGDRI